ncbi:ChrR family anti-sigma-E factor [Litoribrevibacter euphylliae]|uniref:ChrR family anti-sigma-E factor n=1 Tax=Litoribrevibacter euphylliae TaxID=1834034 RepID=A0ABV7HIH6_9GAMM
MTFSAGQLTNALGILVACHIERCQICRSKALMYDQLGGEILESTEPTPVSEDMRQQLLQRIDSTDDNIAPHIQENLDPRVPRPLWRFVENDLNALQWKGFTSSIQEVTLPFSDDHFTAKFYKIAAGKELPEHTHKGNEFTLVLDGSFSDQLGSYHAGDFILADTETIHTPHAHKDKDCICFAVMDAPLKMTGFFGRMLNPFLR